jgi:Domain of unknown function (DUF4942)
MRDFLFNNSDLFPTPVEVIQLMLNGYDIAGKTVLEPSAGTGNIVDYLKEQGAAVIACEQSESLRAILSTKCTIIENDFLQLTSDKISHVNFIIGNPPFSEDEKHILHAWQIAPAGCTIIMLCNFNTVDRQTFASRKELRQIIESYGSWDDLGQCFEQSERKTGVRVAVVKITKPAQSTQDYSGFFMEEDAPEGQAIGLMQYNVVRDIVQRYVGTLKLYERQMDLSVEFNQMAKFFGGDELGSRIMSEGKEKTFNEFKKGLQKSGWKYIFNQMNLTKYTTKGLREDINKFVEEQTKIPFTMRNIYHMLDIVIQTTGQRMDRALLEVFDKITSHHDDNKYFVEGWKTNSHYLVNKKFIIPYGCHVCRYMKTLDVNSKATEMLNDFDKALCYLTGENFDEIKTIQNAYTFHPDAGIWYNTHFFKVRFYKKGTIHVEFKTNDLWARFNQRIAKLKGFPLYEAKKPTSHKEKKEYVRRETETGKHYRPAAEQFKVLFTS